MAVQILCNQQKGPLPLNITFQAPSDAPIYLEVTGSVWTTTANSLIGIVVQLDGQALGQAQVFSNTQSTHRTVVPAYFKIQLKQGQHTLTLGAATSTTTSDFNDFFTAVLHY